MKGKTEKINKEKMFGCCRVESVASVDERGQMVLPKDIRDKHGIKTGDKLALVSVDCCDDSSCVVIIKVDKLSKMLKEVLGPAIKEMFK